MGALIDRTGKRYGRLTALRLHPKRTPAGQARWVCKCDCGKQVIVYATALQQKGTTSCGCLRKEKLIQRSTTHGQAKRGAWTLAYRSYASMLNRCYNENEPAYEDYGGRGITVCRRWRGKKGFDRFFSDLGPRPHGTSLDRVDNNGNYNPKNVRWATKTMQIRNRRVTLLVTYRRKTKTLAEWAALTGISYWTLRNRLNAGDQGSRLFRAVKS